MSFDPLSLFGQGQAGAWYDPSDLSTLFQDSAGTTPVTAHGQPVGRINDKSGNGNHLTQATAGRRPLYQDDSSGKYLLFDGTDDLLSVVLALALPFDRISAIRQVSWTLNDSIFDSNTRGARLYQNAASPQLRTHSGGAGTLQNGGLAVGVNGVVTERQISGAQQLAVNNGSYVSANVGTTAPDTLCVGANAAAGEASNIRFYGVLIRSGQLTDDEIASVRSWMAGKAGLVFPARRKARHSNWLY